MRNRPRRHMRPREIDLLLALLEARFPAQKLNLETLVVEEMDDGGMGSLRFVASCNSQRSFGQEVAEATFVDMDGVLVSATLNLDNHGDLYELDIFKGDNSSLLGIPSTATMTFHNTTK